LSGIEEHRSSGAVLGELIVRQWYALYVVVRHEKKVQSHLALKGIHNYLPLKDSIRWWKDRRKVVSFPLFPGYIFIRIAPAERLSALNTPGVVRLVGAGSDPSPVCTEQIEAIRGLIESRIPFEEELYLNLGRDVVVRRGPLRGLVGKVHEMRGKLRLILSVDLIQRSMSAEVGIHDVEFA
jgi:transcription antitermination factor NusG